MTDYDQGRSNRPYDPYSRDDPYARKDDRRNDRNDPYYRMNDRDDPYNRKNDSRKPVDDPYSRRPVDDPYSRKPVDDPYSRKPVDDPYSRKPVDDPYSRRPVDDHRHGRNDGYLTDSLKNPALSRAPPALYEMDHLVTFTVSPKQGLRTVEDGLERLKQMEMTTGIWTMRVLVSVDEREVVVTEKSTRKELESFPISRVCEPASVTSTHPKDVYNNVVIFVVEGESSKAAPEMNIFQCIGKPGQDLVDDIQAARIGKFPRPPKPKESPKPSRPPTADKRKSGQYYAEPVLPPNGQPPPPKNTSVASFSSGSNPPTARDEVPVESDVEILNRCFDNIESFVASLQQAANAQKQLNNQNNGNMNANELQYLTEKARPPPTREFIDIFQKFKLALTLLPKLNSVLKDPGASDLTRILFSPLALVVNASRSAEGQPVLASSVTAPLLTEDACVLLDANLSDGDTRLWRSLGDAWNVPVEHWKGPLPPPYVPRFSDNSKPARLQQEPQRNNNNNQGMNQGPVPNGGGGGGGGRGGGDYNNPAPYGSNNPSTSNLQSTGNQQGHPPKPAVSVSPEQQQYLNDLKSRNAKVCQVMAARVSKNPQKELTVNAGEYVEVIDDQKNWWKVVNVKLETGYVPKTLLNVV